MVPDVNRFARTMTGAVAGVGVSATVLPQGKLVLALIAVLLSATALLAAVLFARDEEPARRLRTLIREWRRIH